MRIRRTVGRAAVVSVPYSGTRFTKDSLNLDQSIHSFADPGRFYQYLSKYDILDLVIPLREPADNWKAFARRWPEFKSMNDCIGKYNRSWAGMAWILSDPVFNFHVVNIKSPTIKEDLKKIADKLELDFVDDVEQKGQNDEGLREYEYDVRHIYDYKFVKKYFGEYDE